ncbi:MAG: peptidase S10 [Alphaproteobacteria bacterium]|nr:peptidase S10 [Alphaproteobacteria bacterium]MDE2495400.1 peptidase S10 [Alphaproteobacteria bacterium]
MRYATLLIAAVLLVGVAAFAATSIKDADKQATPTAKIDYFQPSEMKSGGTVRMGWSSIPYEAVAGTLVVHPKGWDDAASADGVDKDKNDKASDDKNPTAKASMFYVAYFRKGSSPGTRPITFLYNGGPGSSTVWLHMGAFGPKRVVTANDSHTPAAPYRLVDNQYSLLDASDLVFIDAPGTGFSRVTGKDKEKEFYGVDQDAHAFAAFIKQFLSKYQRWNSPKYLFGESYGTPRSAVLVNELETNDDIDFNGVILLSQILDFDLDIDDPENNPGSNLPYEVALPTYAATAWYHHKLPGKAPADVVPFLQTVENFAMTDYARALTIGNSLDQKRRMEIANKLHQYTGLPVSYILKANLRISGGEFEKNLQAPDDLTTGRLDTRFSGPTMDPLSKQSDYDPQSAAISSAYVSAFNNYVRSDLHYGVGMTYKPEIELWQSWDYKHQPPGAHRPLPITANVMPDLATAMKYNPDLKVMVNGGYFDLATPYYEGWYEMHHLQIPFSLQGNIQYRYYQSGHMVYANEAALKQLHDNVAAFINATDNVK